MKNSIIRAAVFAGLSALAFSAAADVLPAYNLTFSQYTGATPKNYFQAVNPVGWTFGNGGNLIFVDAPGTASDGSYLSVYGPFPNSPAGGNFIEADGNPDYESVFYEQITGLTAGHTYSLSFYQAGGQQTGFGGPGVSTTQQWVVSLGTSSLTDTVNGTNGTYSNADATADTVLTPMMTTGPMSYTPWQYVTMNLTADSSTDLLSFLAWGDGGSTINEPPIVFLSGVNQGDVLPEPSTWAIFGAGLAALLWMRRRGMKTM